MYGDCHSGRVVRFLVASIAAAAVLVFASTVGAQTQTSVKGKGLSFHAGSVHVNARGDVTSAKGSFKVRDHFRYGDLDGRVVCIDRFTTWPPTGFFGSATNVGGVLKRPIVLEDGTVTHFHFQVIDGGPGRPDYAATFAFSESIWESEIVGRGDCGRYWAWFLQGFFWDVNLLGFPGGPPDPSRVVVTRGNFVVASTPSRP